MVDVKASPGNDWLRTTAMGKNKKSTLLCFFFDKVRFEEKLNRAAMISKTGESMPLTSGISEGFSSNYILSAKSNKKKGITNAILGHQEFRASENRSGSMISH